MGKQNKREELSISPPAPPLRPRFNPAAPTDNYCASSQVQRRAWKKSGKGYQGQKDTMNHTKINQAIKSIGESRLHLDFLRTKFCFTTKIQDLSRFNAVMMWFWVLGLTQSLTSGTLCHGLINFLWALLSARVSITIWQIFFRRGGTQWCFASYKVKNGPKRAKNGPTAKTRLKGL